jgi:hypothetical protein
MINLPNVTLICMTNAKLVEHQRALDISSEKIKFGAVKLIHRPDIDTIDKWNKAMVYELGGYVDTDYAIVIHHDGYIINPEMWNPDWLNYDWCSSPWPLPTDDFSYRDINGVIQRVGNSVGLRSKKLMELPKKIGMEWKPFHGFYNEDGYISVNMRHVFEEHGCKFAPLDVAIHFGREHDIPENIGLKTFLFHSL